MYPVSELRTRYDLCKQTEINRRKHLGIIPVKIDKQFCISEKQLQLLDQFDAFLKSRPGVKMSDFNIKSSAPSIDKTMGKAVKDALSSSEKDDVDSEPVNITIKVPRKSRQYWTSQCKLAGVTMTEVLVEALIEWFGEPK